MGLSFISKNDGGKCHVATALLLGDVRRGSRETGEEEKEERFLQYSDGLQMFLISLGCARCQVDRCCWENLYYSKERLTFREWERGREAAHPFREEMTLNWTANYL